MIRSGLKIGIFAGALVLAAEATWAKGPVNVEANSMEINEANKQATFKGNVVATRENERMEADVMVVDYQEVKQSNGSSATEVSTLDSKGNVRITTKTQVITGEWSKMNVQANTLVVGGNVRVVQGKTVLTGPKMDVDLNTNRTVISGDSGGRVRGVFVPK